MGTKQIGTLGIIVLLWTVACGRTATWDDERDGALADRPVPVDVRDVQFDRVDVGDAGDVVLPAQCLCTDRPDWGPCPEGYFCCPCNGQCMDEATDRDRCECPQPGFVCDTDGGTTDVVDVPDAARCSTGMDCNDFDPCTDDLCVGGSCQNPRRDRDRDSHVDQLCGGDDCNDMNPAVFPGAREVCSDTFDNDCNGRTDCADPACATAPNCRCVPTGNEQCSDGMDNDCDNAVDCMDTDCTMAANCCRPTGLERDNCSDRRDNDCNGRIDCADPSCATDMACTGCIPGTVENCTDRRDNNCDMLVDCADPMCRTAPVCRTMCAPEACNDGMDNDCNLLIDCADPACVFDARCTCRPEVCNNGGDDDCDSRIDCYDSDCRTDARCIARHESCVVPLDIGSGGTFRGDTTGFMDVERSTRCGGAGAGEAVFRFTLTRPSRVELDTRGSSFDTVLYVRAGNCTIGRELACEDDSGGSRNAAITIPILYPGTYYVFVDGFTTGNAGPYVFNARITPEPPEICNNGIDDDGDRLVDCADPNCGTERHCLGCSREFGPVACTDGRDNDCDATTGFSGSGIDCRDSDCHASSVYNECCDNRDDNGNGIIDEFACRCASDADCRSGYRCYTQTVGTCAPPCHAFFGDICASVAPGSVCDRASGQCRFP